MPRMFVAIYPIPFKKEIEFIQKSLSTYFFGKLVESNNLHITLSFLGNIKTERIKEIDEKLSLISKMFNPFEIRIDGLELIPNENFIRVIALKIESEKIRTLINTIKKTIDGDVKPPHLTLARVKRIKNKSSLIEMAKKIELNKSILVDSIKLMESKLTRNGPIYKVIKNYMLRTQ